MGCRVGLRDGGHRLVGDGGFALSANRFLEHLEVRCFSPLTVRVYAFDFANFEVFLDERSLAVGDVGAADVFAYLEWQRRGATRRRRR